MGAKHEDVARLRGTSDRALEAAERTAETVHLFRSWTPRKVIDAIRELENADKALNAACMQKQRYALLRAARNLFGSWDEALRAAGFDPASIRRRRPAWTKSELIALLRSYAEAGRPLTLGGVRPESVRNAILRLFGSFEAALRKADVQHLAVRPNRWSKAAIVERILALQEAGEGLNCQAVMKSNPRLYKASHRFGGWSKVLAAAGIDPDTVRRWRRPWTPDEILHELRRRAARDKPARCRSAIRPSSFVRACTRVFGSLDEAANAAGIDPEKIGHRLHPPGRRRSITTGNNTAPSDDRPFGRRQCLNRAEIIKSLLRMEADGLPLNHSAVLKHDSHLHRSTLRVFGKWEKAMRAIGKDPAKIRRHRKWSHQAIIRRIQTLDREGKPLNSSAVQRTEATLVSAADRWFGSWNEALWAAGFDPSAWLRRVPDWTPERVIAAIQDSYRAGGRVNHASFGRNSMARAACLMFGSWDAALRAAGFDPAEMRVYKAPWTPESLVAELKRKAKVGEPLNARDVSPGLRKRGTAYFGSWDATLIAAGLDPRKVRKSMSRGNRRPRKSMDLEGHAMG